MSAVEEYVSLSEDSLVPAVEMSVSTVESSISLRDNDIPPGYTAAATFPVSEHMRMGIQGNLYRRTLEQKTP